MGQSTAVETVLAGHAAPIVWRAQLGDGLDYRLGGRRTRRTDAVQRRKRLVGQGTLGLRARVRGGASVLRRDGWVVVRMAALNLGVR